MAKASRRSSKPSDPQVIMVRAAEARAVARTQAKDPKNWGLAPELADLATSADLDVRRDRKRIVAAMRRDPFDALRAHGGLSEAEHRAARKLFRDVCLRFGIQVEDRRADLGVRVQAKFDPTAGPVTGPSLAAAARVRGAMAGVGLLSARVLMALISPMLERGHVEDWRGVVQAVTGEDNAVAQGAVVRLACKALAEHYDAVARAPRGANDDAPSLPLDSD